jgi:hypothetical protein
MCEECEKLKQELVKLTGSQNFYEGRSVVLTLQVKMQDETINKLTAIIDSYAKKGV